MIAGKEKKCDYNEFRRPRYFHGMLVDDKQFLAEQGYHIGKRRLLNRTLYGSGVVCGLGLKWKKGRPWIEVESGLALDCAGNEIWVENSRRIDLLDLIPKATKEKGTECLPENGEEKKSYYYLGIRYNEVSTDPVSVYLPGGSCEERACEYSRVKEGYCIEVVECIRPTYDPGLLKRFCECAKGCAPEDKPDECSEAKELGCWNCEGLEGKELCKCHYLAQFCEQSIPCPDCGPCDKPDYVVLGKIEVDRDRCIKTVCINECRKYVLTGRLLQHLVVSTLAGAEEYFKIKVTDRQGSVTIADLPKFGEMAQNPINAFCKLLRYLVVQGGELDYSGCKELFAAPPELVQKEEEKKKSSPPQLEKKKDQ